MSDESAPAPQDQHSSPQLEYARPTPLVWIGRHRGLLIFLAVCIAIGGSIHWYWTPLKRRATWLYYSRQAAAHVMPVVATDAVITDPVRAGTVPTTNPDYLVAGSPQPQYAQYLPGAYRNLLSVDSRLGMTGGIGTPVIFMGTLKRPDGTPRLVIITGGHGESRQLVAATLVLVLPIPKFLDAPPPLTGLPRIGMGMAGSGPPPVFTQMRTGVADPYDPSHIAIEFTAAVPMLRSQTSASIGASTAPGAIARSAVFPRVAPPAGGMIDAYLKNDDSIEFTLRSSFGLTNPGFNQRSIMPGDEESVRARAAKVATPGSTPTPARGRARVPATMPGAR